MIVNCMWVLGTKRWFSGRTPLSQLSIPGKQRFDGQVFLRSPRTISCVYNIADVLRSQVTYVRPPAHALLFCSISSPRTGGLSYLVLPILLCGGVSKCLSSVLCYPAITSFPLSIVPLPAGMDSCVHTGVCEQPKCCCFLEGSRKSPFLPRALTLPQVP